MNTIGFALYTLSKLGTYCTYSNKVYLNKMVEFFYM